MVSRELNLKGSCLDLQWGQGIEFGNDAQRWRIRVGDDRDLDRARPRRIECQIDELTMEVDRFAVEELPEHLHPLAGALLARRRRVGRTAG